MCIRDSADAYILMPRFGAGTPRECYPKAEATASALELDDSLAEAHTSRARVLSDYDLDFDAAASEYRRAIALDPNYPTAHQWYGNVLVSLGQFDDGIAELKRGIELDPLSLIIHSDLAFSYRLARRNEKAREHLRTALEIDPSFSFAHRTFGMLLETQGDFAAAISEYQKARAINEDPYAMALLVHAYGSSGNKNQATDLLGQLYALSRQRYVSSFSFALAYLGLGDKEKALGLLEQSYEDRGGSLVIIRVEPLLDVVRDNPRFEALVRKVFAKAPPPNAQ